MSEGSEKEEGGEMGARGKKEGWDLVKWKGREGKSVGGSVDLAVLVYLDGHKQRVLLKRAAWDSVIGFGSRYGS